jgi:hypothetical protein
MVDVDVDGSMVDGSALMLNMLTLEKKPGHTFRHNARQRHVDRAETEFRHTLWLLDVAAA